MFNFEFENPFSKGSEPKPQEGMGGSRSMAGFEETAADELAGAEKKEGENLKFKKIRESVEANMDAILAELGITPEEAVMMESVFIDKLLEKGAVSIQDLGFSSIEDAVRQAISIAAKRRIYKKAGERKHDIGIT